MPFNASRRAELLDLVPYGLVATRRWLLRAGMSMSALDNQIKSGQLLSVRPGVYVRPGTRLVWQSVVCSLERMGTDLVVGGATALEEQGRAPELPLSGRRSIQLHGLDPLPPWANRLDLPETFRRRSTAWCTASGTGSDAEGRPVREPIRDHRPRSDAWITATDSTVRRRSSSARCPSSHAGTDRRSPTGIARERETRPDSATLRVQALPSSGSSLGGTR